MLLFQPIFYCQIRINIFKYFLKFVELRTELCASLLDHVKTNKPCGPALVYLAK